MTDSGRTPVKYDRPPVLEVACGIAFALPNPLKMAHVGLYWSRVRDEFPRCDDAPPIAMIVEAQGTPDSTEYNLQLQHSALPPMRRAWLINEAGTHLLQLQDDRFLFNWKRTEQRHQYPSYKAVITDFRAQWSKYKSFLIELGLGDPTPTQLDLTYFNFLPGGREWFRDYQRVDSGDRFLPNPDAINFNSIYSLPGSSGRLHVAAASARHAATGERGVRLDLTARGMPKDMSEAGCQEWFDLAHEWITHGFTDLTTPAAHKIWGRTA